MGKPSKSILAHVDRAHSMLGSPTSAELEQARKAGSHAKMLHVLMRLADRRREIDVGFWSLMALAFRTCDDDLGVRLCHYRRYESEFGFIEARLWLTPTSDGGRRRGVFTDYRPDWNLGILGGDGGLQLYGAPITVEGSQCIDPGGEGLVRLHPFHRPSWRGVRVGHSIDMHEGARVLGRATVTDVCLDFTD